MHEVMEALGIDQQSLQVPMTRLMQSQKGQWVIQAAMMGADMEI